MLCLKMLICCPTCFTILALQVVILGQIGFAICESTGLANAVDSVKVRNYLESNENLI